MMKDLRASFNVLPLEEYKMAGKASQILTWDRNSQFCPACGVRTVQTGPIAKQCPQCHQEIYPRISCAHQERKRQRAAGSCTQFPRNIQRTGSRLPRTGRNAGRMRMPRSDGRNPIADKESEVFRKPALAISKRNHDRLCRRIRKRNHQAAG